MSDYAVAYSELRTRVTELLRDRPEDEVEQSAPATPGWRVRDITAHLGGVCDDIAHGNLAGVATNAWTQAQVDKRVEWPFARVLDDWNEQAAVVEPMMNDIGTPMGQMVFDAWTHEQDIRGALGEPGARECAAVDIAFDWWVAAGHEQLVTDDTPGSFRLVTEHGEIVLGPGAPAVTLRTSRYEFLRALTGRRSRAQVQRLDAECDQPLDELLFTTSFFTPAAHDLIE